MDFKQTAYPENILIKYEGLDADNGEIPIEDLTDSLIGWRDYLNLCASMFLKKEFTSVPLSNNLKPVVNVKAINKGSFDISIEFIMGAAALALAIKNDRHVDQFLSAFGKWLKELFIKYIEEKKAFHTSVEVAKALDEFAKTHELKPSTDLAQPQKVAFEIDYALKKATRPIEHSAETIKLLSTDLNCEIIVTQTEKRAIHNYFYFKEERQDIFNAKVILNSINLNTRHVGLVIDQCSDPIFKHQQAGYIKSNSVKKPGNTFTWSLHNQKVIEIWVEPIRDSVTGDLKTWNFYDEYPKEETPLLELGIK